MFQLVLAAASIIGTALTLARLKKANSDLKNRVIAEAKRVAGLSAGREETLSEFRTLLGEPSKDSQWDLDRPFRMWKDDHGNLRTEGVSTCGLVARGIQYRAGIRWPEYTRPYVAGRVFTDMIGRAERMGAWVKPKIGTKPGPGDCVVITSPLSHMFTIVDEDDTYYYTIEGGSVDTENKRKVGEKEVSNLQCVRAGKRVKHGLAIYGWIDPDLLGDVSFE